MSNCSFKGEIIEGENYVKRVNKYMKKEIECALIDVIIIH